MVSLQTLNEERDAIRAVLEGREPIIPRGMYRAHKPIAPFTCAHCGRRVKPGWNCEMGYNSCLPTGHKEICALCFYGS